MQEIRFRLMRIDKQPKEFYYFSLHTLSQDIYSPFDVNTGIKYDWDTLELLTKELNMPKDTRTDQEIAQAEMEWEQSYDYSLDV